MRAASAVEGCFSRDFGFRAQAASAVHGRRVALSPRVITARTPLVPFADHYPAKWETECRSGMAKPRKFGFGPSESAKNALSEPFKPGFEPSQRPLFSANRFYFLQVTVHFTL